ncbi:MAG: DMT family protein [Brevinematia bacterium]
MLRITLTILLLVCSNIFMTFAWYGHLRNLNNKPWIFASVVSWSIAFFEYLIQVPANRIGYSVLSLPQLKILQEVITLSVFVPFSIFYMGQSLKWNHLVAGAFILCAVYFAFKH